MAKWAWQEEGRAARYGEVRLYQFYVYRGEGSIKLYDGMSALSSRDTAEAVATGAGAVAIEEWDIDHSVASERTATARVLDRIEAATGQGRR